MLSFDGKYRISSIVCAYNEEDTVGDIVTALSVSHLIDEVIVVNDGSSDGTSQALEDFSFDPKVRVIELHENRGKGFAMACGASSAGGEILLFFDADIVGILEDDQIERLVSPPVSGKAEMVIGYLINNPLERFYNPFRFISGQRVVFRRDLIPIIDEMKKLRFGVEMVINLHFLREGREVIYLPIEDMIHITKMEKYPLHLAIKEFYKEGTEIAISIRLNYPMLVEHIKNRSRRILDL